MTRKLVGWYVAIPANLRQRFDELYPGRRNKKILTVTAIKHAIDVHPTSLYNLYRESNNELQRASEDAKRDSADTAGDEEACPLCGERRRSTDSSGN